MRRTLALTVAAAAALAGCGGGEDDVKALLDEAFNKPIKSAVVTAEVAIEIEGVAALKDPIRLKLTGPYEGGVDGKLPAFDWDVSLSGGGQGLEADLVSTRENVFVSLQGTAYEVGEQAVGAFNSQLAAASRRQPDGGLGRFGIDAADWLEDGKDEGTQKIAGVETTHIAAGVDVGRMLDDLNKIIDRAGSAGVSGPAPPPQLTADQKRQVQDVVRDANLDVYVGKDDKVIRRISANLDLNVPEGARTRLGGIQGGKITFTVEFADIGKPISVKAPRDARPIGELSRQLGGLGALAGGAAGGAPPPGAPPIQGGGGAGEGGDAFTRYSKCLEDADPSDLAAIQACSELLQ